MWLKRAGLLLGGLILAFGLHIGYLFWTGNFHEVVAGELYRSGQLGPAQLTRAVDRYKIRTVINLRGENPKAAWYRQEVETAASLGIRHVDFRMSASQPLSLERSRELLALMRTAPKPILVHCMSGSDRTGLASMLYLQQIAGAGEETAEFQLSLLFGHISIPYISKGYAMDETWESLEKAFGIES